MSRLKGDSKVIIIVHIKNETQGRINLIAKSTQIIAKVHDKNS